MRRVITMLSAAAVMVCADDASRARREEYLKQTLAILTPSYAKDTARISAHERTWEEWQKRTGELPPDFSAMPSIPMLPDPLRLRNGSRITSPSEWQEQRRWIREQYQQWVFGKMPPPPGNLRSVVTSERREGDVTVRDVRLDFGPDHKGTLRVQLVIPPVSGPKPVFLTNHPRNRPWIAPAVRRGYIGCIYYATDPIYGTGDDSDKFVELYPEYDFSALARWAWSAMRAVDYLVTLPEVDKSRIGLSGHSRNGKQALLAAAFDERIAAVVPSSGNTGEGVPWRYTTDPFAGETIEQITGRFPGWFHPRLRFFAGREDKLPVDQNSLMALVAPRGLMLASSFSESQGNPFAFEQAYSSVLPVYEFLGHPERLGLWLRPGEHPTQAEDIEQFVDFFDHVFGRGRFGKPETWVRGYSSTRVTAPTPPKESAPFRDRLRWTLGEEPAAAPFPNRTTLAGAARTADGYIESVLGRPLRVANAARFDVGFGDDLHGDLWLPAEDGRPKSGRHAVVIWLHPYAYATGYSRYARPTFEALIRRGFGVFAFDQIGFGTRVHQARRFYERYPRWSLLGKMVADTRAAMDALAALDAVDPSRVYLAGYSLGAKVAIFVAAVDERAKAIVAASGVEALARIDTEGRWHYSNLHRLAPRMSRPLFDYDELLAAIAPRPVYVRAPLLDRYAPVEDIRRIVERSGRHVHLDTPLDFDRFQLSAQEQAFDWLAKQAGL
ncbi:MAG TPA: acetylxylan esterase [Bryobacteraceae bacterium]|nr:acetylxylan esterase [Bryobacteraceae bacterium]